MVSARKPVAYLTRELAGGTAPEQLFSGALIAARKRGHDLVVLRGGQTGKDPGTVIYDLVDDSFAGIITWASPDANEHAKQFYKRFAPVPVVGLTVQLPGCPAITTDSLSALRFVMEHMIVHHHKKKIIFVRGPATHDGAIKRFQAYQEALRDHGIAEDERLVSPHCTWDKTEGPRMVQYFLDEKGLVPGKDFDTFVCVNDNIAIGALEEFKRRGIDVPEVVAVTGCNDSAQARYMTPPITTVSMPFIEQAAAAFDTINAIVDGRPVQQETCLPARLMIAQSCGCPSHQIEAVTTGTRAFGGHGSIAAYFSALLGPLHFAGQAKTLEDICFALGNGHQATGETEQLISSSAEQFLQGFAAAFRNRGKRSQYFSAITDTVNSFYAMGIAPERMHSAISVLRKRMLPSLLVPFLRKRAEDLWAEGRVLISEAAGRLRDANSLRLISQERVIGQLSAKLSVAQDMAAILKIVQQDLPQLNIASFYLALYEGEAGWDRKSMPRHLRLMTAFNAKGKIAIDERNARRECRGFLASLLSAASERQTLLVTPLNFNDTQLGVAVFGLGNEDGSIYEAIKIQLSSAIYGTLLRQTLKETMETMEAKVTEVSSSSEQISQSVQGGSAAMEEVANSIHGISESIREVMTVIGNAVQLTTSASGEISVLNNQALEINTILGIISDIAKRTNLLALNASIEAARAGEHGRGFGVVAEEVKSLALTTATSSDNIRSMINKVQHNTSQVYASINDVSEIMQKVSGLSHDISSAIAEQTRSTDEVSNVLSEAALGTNLIAQALAQLDAIGKSASRV